jgi:hypothetical protein
LDLHNDHLKIDIYIATELAFTDEPVIVDSNIAFVGLMVIVVDVCFLFEDAALICWVCAEV